MNHRAGEGRASSVDARCRAGSSRGFWLTNRVANPVLRPVLRSRLGRVFGRRLAIIRYRGRRTGTEHELVVRYVREGHRVWVMPGSPERKTWWRNLRCPAEVDVWLAGRKYRGTALALEGPERKEELAEAIDTYTTRIPRARKQLGVTEVRGATTNAPTVMMVSIDLQDETLHDAPP